MCYIYQKEATCFLYISHMRVFLMGNNAKRPGSGRHMDSTNPGCSSSSAATKPGCSSSVASEGEGTVDGSF